MRDLKPPIFWKDKPPLNQFEKWDISQIKLALKNI